MGVNSRKSVTNPMKRAIKRFIIHTRDYILSLKDQENEKPKENHGRDQADFAWPWLNSVLAKLLTEGGRTLRPNYAWGVLQGAYMAKAIGITRISVIECGVAGGNGLISLENISDKVQEIFDLGIDVYGFDTGTGLPKPVDYRDLPNLWSEAAFPMDVEKLKSRLKKDRLILGNVENTVPIFLNSNPAPIAFISFDVDYYSSTMQAFKLLEGDQSLLLPRVHCYFDDILGFTHSDFTGERLAIHEFNASQATRKISKIYGLENYLPTHYVKQIAPEKQYMAHIFDHQLYCRNDGLVRRSFGGCTDLAAK